VCRRTGGLGQGHISLPPFPISHGAKNFSKKERGSLAEGEAARSPITFFLFFFLKTSIKPAHQGMFTVYILLSLRDKKTYVSYTNNFERRFRQHNLGRAKSTKHRVLFELLFKEEFENSIEAKKREI